MRSAKAPTIRQQVMPAKVAWKAANSSSGMYDALAEGGAHREGAGRRVEHALHEQPVEAADEGVALGEGQAVAVDAPQHDDHREGDHHLHQHRQHVLAAHQAAVEQRQAGHGHHDDQQRWRPSSRRCRPCWAPARAQPRRQRRLRRPQPARQRRRPAAAAAGSRLRPRRPRRAPPAACASAARAEHSRLRPRAREASSFFMLMFSFCWARRQSASLPVSPVRMRTTCSRS